jgi:hypothetical protein
MHKSISLTCEYNLRSLSFISSQSIVGYKHCNIGTEQFFVRSVCFMIQGSCFKMPHWLKNGNRLQSDIVGNHRSYDTIVLVTVVLEQMRDIHTV